MPADSLFSRERFVERDSLIRRSSGYSPKMRSECSIARRRDSARTVTVGSVWRRGRRPMSVAVPSASEHHVEHLCARQVARELLCVLWNELIEENHDFVLGHLLDVPADGDLAFLE